MKQPVSVESVGDKISSEVHPWTPPPHTHTPIYPSGSPPAPYPHTSMTPPTPASPHHPPLVLNHPYTHPSHGHYLAESPSLIEFHSIDKNTKLLGKHPHFWCWCFWFLDKECLHSVLAYNQMTSRFLGWIWHIFRSTNRCVLLTSRCKSSPHDRSI